MQMHYDSVGVRLHACMCKWCVCVRACMRSCICVCVCVCLLPKPCPAIIYWRLQKEGKGVQVAYYVNARLVRNRKQMTHEVNNTDLECADDMAFGLLLPGQPNCHDSRTQPILLTTWSVDQLQDNQDSEDVQHQPVSKLRL